MKLKTCKCGVVWGNGFCKECGTCAEPEMLVRPTEVHVYFNGEKIRITRHHAVEQLHVDVALPDGMTPGDFLKSGGRFRVTAFDKDNNIVSHTTRDAQERRRGAK